MNGAVVCAWAVHAYTAGGAIVALCAVHAVFAAAYGQAFLWMALALFIDSTDGTLARRFRVKEVLPQFDGARLDDIVDYLNYVFVPIVLAVHAGLLPAGDVGLAVAAAPLAASGYGFCQADAKTADYFFKGFPSYWNVVVFYFYLLETPAWFNAGTLLALSILVFVPIRFLYPSRNRTARRTTYALGALWGLCSLVMLVRLPDRSPWLSWVSLAFPAYYCALSVHLHLRRAPR